MPTPVEITPLPTSAIYDNIEVLGLAFDGQTFPSSEAKIFDALVAKHSPTSIIEVGTHKGGSAYRWAKLAGPACRIYCVDTWLEAADAVLSTKKTYGILYQNHHPLTYWQFLANMKTLGVHEQITPILNTSSEGAIILKAHGVKAQIIYIDGSHTGRQAYYDMHDYWPMLESGGSMLVDDLTLYPMVYGAVLRFVDENNLWLNWEPVEDRMFALIAKP